MSGLGSGARRGMRLARLAAAALCGGVVSVVAAGSPAAEAFSPTPQWFTTGGTSVSSLACGTWYYATMGAQTGGGSASVTIVGGGGGGGGSSSSSSLGNPANTGAGGQGGTVTATFTVPAGESIATIIGCGGGGGAVHSSGSSATGGAAGSGYAAGGAGGNWNASGANQSGGGGGGGSTTVCVYGSASTPCGTLLAIAGGGGGAGAAGCLGNGGNGGNGNAGATTGTASNSEVNSAAPGGSANGQGFGGGGGGSDSDKQTSGGGGGGGVGAAGSTTGTTATTGGGGAANSTGGAAGTKIGSASGTVTGNVGNGPNASGTGGAGNVDTSDTQHPGGGGGGGGYYGGGSGASNGCTLTPELGAGGGGAGSSWVSTAFLTSFVNGSNPAFTAGTTTSSTACGESASQGTSGATTGVGGSGASSSSTVEGGWAGCPGNTGLTWSALPGAPRSVSGTGGSGSIVASWTAPADSGTASISGYTVSATPVPSGTTISQTFNSTATTETLSGLTNGTSYDVSVQAVTSVGTGPAASATNNPVEAGQAPAITSASNTTFTAGSAGTFTVTTTGAPTPALSETGSLPSGVGFVDNGDGTATLSGTPAPGTGGTYGITITAANGIGSNASQSFSLAVDQAPAITSGASTTFVVGSAGTFSVTSTGFPTAAFSESGVLPSGVGFVDNGDGTATLSGTPAPGTGGTYGITIGASNGVSPDASQSFTLQVDAAPTIVSAAATTFTEGAGGTFTVVSSGVPTAALSETGSLPSGLTFADNGDGTGTLSGTPATGSQGTYDLTFTASNGVSPDASQSFTLTVDGPPSITSVDSTTFTVGAPGTFEVTTQATPTASLSETGTLPSGVGFSDNGDGTATLSGTPAAGSDGVYSFTVSASNGISPDASQTFTLTVDTAPTITSGAATTFVEGAAGTFTVTSHGVPTAALTETGSLPSGVTFTDNGDGTATLAGTPAAGTNGVYAITITASNGVSPDAGQSFTLTVDAAPAITSGATATFTEGAAGTFTVTTTGRPTAALTETGSLPSGVTFTDNGDGTATLAGTPAAGTNGVYAITITASNGVSPDASQSFTLTVQGPPSITSGTSATFDEGHLGVFTVTTTGVPAPALTETGSLPSGVTFTDNGDGTASLVGAPAAGSAGTYPLTIAASNGVSPDASQSFTLTVDAAPAITSGSSATFTEGEAGSFTVTSTGTPTPALTETGSLPSGVTFTDNGDGTATLAGTPAMGSNGTYTIGVTASNGVTPDATQTVALTVDASLAITSAPSATFTEGHPGTFTVTTSGAPVPTLAESGSLPGGVSFTDNGNGTATLAGRPTTGSNGVYALTITADNGVGPDATQSFTLTVDAAPAITSAAATAFTVGQAGTFTVTATGRPTPALTETGTLPSGVTFTDNGDGTATLAGTPAAGTTGSYALTLAATNGVNPHAAQAFILSVNGPPAITSGDSVTFAAGFDGSFTVTATGPPTPALTETGSLPSGVTFTDNGDGTATLAGTPAGGTQGVYTLTITAANGVSPDATQGFTLTVSTAPVFTSAAADTFYLHASGSFTPTATGSPTPTISELGTLPAGVTFAHGVLAGTPTVQGTYAVLFTASNGVSGQVTQNFTLTVAGLTISTPTTLTPGTAGKGYTLQFAAKGGQTPLKWGKVGHLPKGLKLSKAGLLSGTISSSVPAGTYTVTVKVQDSTRKAKQKVTGTFKLTIAG